MTEKSQQTAVTSKRSTAREPILDAAERVIAGMGAGHMTLEAVAREAGVSKGGLLYHFPSKDVLLSAMVERYVAQLSEGAKLEREVNVSASLLRSLVQRRTDDSADARRGARIAHGMIAAVTERPSLLDPLRAYHKQLWAEIKAQGGAPERLALAWLALEGLLFQDMFNTSPLDPTERGLVIDEILQIVDAQTV